MASQLVLEALESLHKELDKMQPAIRQVEIAEQVITQTKKLPEHYLELITRIEGQETQFKEKLVNYLNGYAEQVREEVENLVTTTSITLEDLTEHEKQLKQELISELNGYADQVRKEVNILVAAAKSTLIDLTNQDAEFKQKLAGELNGHKDLIHEEVNTLVSTASTTIANLVSHEEKLETIRKNLEPFVGQLASLQLEPRLDKLQDTADKKFSQLTDSTDLLQSGVKSIHDRLYATEVVIGNRLTEEGKIRRDQLESGTNAIKQEVRGLTDNFNSLEARLADQIREQAKRQEFQIKLLHEEASNHAKKNQEGFSAMTQQFQNSFKQIMDQAGHLQNRLDLVEQQQKAQKTLSVITWVLITVATSAIVFAVRHYR